MTLFCHVGFFVKLPGLHALYCGGFDVTFGYVPVGLPGSGNFFVPSSGLCHLDCGHGCAFASGAATRDSHDAGCGYVDSCGNASGVCGLKLALLLLLPFSLGVCPVGSPV